MRFCMGSEMVKPRIKETDTGITGEFDTEAYNLMQRMLRDRGWMETRQIINSGITQGIALEVGPGPGYLGLEWLKNTTHTRLKGLDISDDMMNIARRNADEYGLEDRVEYVHGDAGKIPFEDAEFDSVFSNGSFHEWAEPVAVINEMARVLKPGGRFFISDLKRNMTFIIRGFLWFVTNPKHIRPGLITSIKAAYTRDEAEELLAQTDLAGGTVRQNPIGITLSGEKKQ